MPAVFVPTDWAYCAGLYEGEGSISSSVNLSAEFNDKRCNRLYIGRRRGLILRIQMMDLDALYQFWETVDCGQLNGPIKQTGLGTKDTYLWKCTKFDDIEYIMVHMWPWLSKRRRDQYKSAVFKYLSWGGQEYAPSVCA